jgi:hypothetical protein
VVTLEQVLAAAERHGKDEGYESWVGDLEELLRAVWPLLTGAQKRAAFASPEGADLLDGLACYLDA